MRVESEVKRPVVHVSSHTSLFGDYRVMLLINLTPSGESRHVAVEDMRRVLYSCTLYERVRSNLQGVDKKLLQETFAKLVRSDQ